MADLRKEPPLNTDGTGFATLHSFTATEGLNPPFINSDGAGPIAGVILSGNALYGTTYGGGSSGNGTVFKVNTDGTGFTTLHHFTVLSGVDYGTNSDGANPWAGLAVSGNTLYGTAMHGGSSANGTVFALNTDGTAFTTLHSFTVRPYGSANSDGAYPNELIFSGNVLYGTTYAGGDSGNGTVFSISLVRPQLTITSDGANVILTWPTDLIGFSLQFTTNVASLAVWTTVSTAPVVVNGQTTVTNPISGTKQFYRLGH